MSWYMLRTRGIGNRRTVSTSNTKNKTDKIKKYRENGDRDPFKRSSKPHSIGFALSIASFVWGGVNPKKIINNIKTNDKDTEVIKISQNIWFRCRHTFRYAYLVTTYLPFRRERRAICTHSRALFRLITFLSLLLSPFLLYF